jgi:plasmid stabilization system protein ParE
VNRIDWADGALSDLQRLYDFLAPVNPSAAAQTVNLLVNAPERLLDRPRLGEPLDEFAPREVRRLLAGRYEIRYEVRLETLAILRIFHVREDR